MKIESISMRASNQMMSQCFYPCITEVHLVLPVEMYRTANGGVALKLISEISELQKESNNNFRYASQFFIPTAKFTTK